MLTPPLSYPNTRSGLESPGCHHCTSQHTVLVCHRHAVLAPDVVIDVLTEVSGMCPGWVTDLDTEHVAAEEAGAGVISMSGLLIHMDRQSGVGLSKVIELLNS